MATSIDDTYALPDSDGVADATPVTADTAEGNEFTNDGRIILVTQNAAASAVNLNIAFPPNKDVDGVAHPDKVVSVPANDKLSFRFPVEWYGNTVVITADTTDLSFWLIR